MLNLFLRIIDYERKSYCIYFTIGVNFTKAKLMGVNIMLSDSQFKRWYRLQQSHA